MLVFGNMLYFTWVHRVDITENTFTKSNKFIF